jgi:hypothetical protein
VVVFAAAVAVVFAAEMLVVVAEMTPEHPEPW